jgi:hypothetical protein
MVFARALDVTYLAADLGAPGALARTRALGLGLYLDSFPANSSFPDTLVSGPYY